MPTFGVTDRFKKDLSDLDFDERDRFERCVNDKFVPDLINGGFRAGLRVKIVQGTGFVYEMTWAPDGRATWQYGDDLHPGVPHVIWRRVGTHDIFRSP